MGNDQSKNVPQEPPPSAKEFFEMLQKDPEPHQEFHPARYLATHAMQKGAQAGTAAGLLFGTALFALGRRGAITKYSTLGGLIGGAGGLGLCFAKSENPDEKIPMTASGVNARCEMLLKNHTEHNIDKAGLYGGALGLMTMTGPFRIGGAFAGYGFSTLSVRMAGPRGQQMVHDLDRETAEWAAVGQKCLGLNPTSVNCERKPTKKGRE